ncbi:MAG: hypothetical protein K6A23_13260 [Butyrivibrio sp.]|nr:hypothetical protein [Butyrivibrio sp.]
MADPIKTTKSNAGVYFNEMTLMANPNTFLKKHVDNVLGYSMSEVDKEIVNEVFTGMFLNELERKGQIRESDVNKYSQNITVLSATEAGVQSIIDSLRVVEFDENNNKVTKSYAEKYNLPKITADNMYNVMGHFVKNMYNGEYAEKYLDGNMVIQQKSNIEGFLDQFFEPKLEGMKELIKEVEASKINEQNKPQKPTISRATRFFGYLQKTFRINGEARKQYEEYHRQLNLYNASELNNVIIDPEKSKKVANYEKVTKKYESLKVEAIANKTGAVKATEVGNLSKKLGVDKKHTPSKNIMERAAEMQKKGMVMGQQEYHKPVLTNKTV